MRRKNLGLALSLSKGFTLVELLVVISIIAILSVVGLVGMTGAQKQARDSTRRNDLSQYRIALENYYATNGTYITSATVGLAGTVLNGETTNLDSYLTQYPADPKTTSGCTFTGTDYNYCYISNVNGTEYVIATRLETGKCFAYCGVNNTSGGGTAGTFTCAAITAACPLFD